MGMEKGTEASESYHHPETGTEPLGTRGKNELYMDIDELPL